MLGGNLNAIYSRIQRVYPGLLGAVFMGVRHNENEHREIAIATGMPWLIANFSDEAKMRELYPLYSRRRNQHGAPFPARGSSAVGTSHR